MFMMFSCQSDARPFKDTALILKHLKRKISADDILNHFSRTINQIYKYIHVNQTGKTTEEYPHGLETMKM